MSKEQRPILSTASRLSSFVEHASSNPTNDMGRRIMSHLSKLSKEDASRQDVQSSAESITRELLAAAFHKQSSNDVLLIPILRAGISMWGPTNEFFNYPESTFVMGDKRKETGEVSVIWPKKNKLSGKHLIVLDPIIAMGDTLIATHTQAMSGQEQPASLTILSCYAAPEGVQAVLEETDANLVVGCMAETVDLEGYLVPPTHGDMGDKLFGLATVDQKGRG